MAQNSGYPSLAALLGLLAVAGYQNRDKLGEWFNSATSGQAGGASQDRSATPASPSQGGGLGGLLGGATAGGLGGLLSGGLGELVDKFRNAGHGREVDSWVASGSNEPIDRRGLSEALGDDMIEELTRRTGLDREELLKRLSATLPDAIDRYTPQGRVPPASEFATG